ncbi:hypothetical protein CTAYLR_000941 [Chrysophaeum taylorii]|uniref:Uncharacterized protein n=1 Tax=Chrysophaeum taylorii TaxID=2483200 RepID=A0AAD7UHE8_9STRA|nr:hypothetical protein CTAYLR_000941 [Chrysophaeum taylorii]
MVLVASTTTALGLTAVVSRRSAVAGMSLVVVSAPQSTSTTNNNNEVAKEFISGLAGGAAQRIAKDIVLHPIDTVKTRLQRQDSRRLSRRLFLNPYAGVVPPLVVGVPAGALFFGVKDATNAALRPLELAPDLEEALVVAVANIPYWLARAPAELLKTRRQLVEGGESALDLAKDIVSRDGLEGLYVGAFEAYAYALPTDIVKFLVYRRLKARFRASDKALLGAFASATAQLATTPLDVVKTRAMDADADYIPIPTRALKIAKEEGPAALFAGVTPRLLRAAVSGALQFSTYELTKRLFRTPTTSK